MAKQKEKNLTVRLEIFGALILLGFICFFGILGIKDRVKLANVNAQIVNVENKTKAKQAKLNALYRKKAINSTNSGIRLSMRQLLAQNYVIDDSKNLLKILFTYDSHKSYVRRKELAKRYVSKEVLKDKSIFADDSDPDGKSQIDMLGLKSNFDSSKAYLDAVTDDDNVNVLIVGSFDTWLPGRAVQRVYVTLTGTYDLSSRKFIKLHRDAKLLSDSGKSFSKLILW